VEERNVEIDFRCTAERGYELPPSDADCHLTQLSIIPPCDVGEDSTLGPTAKKLAVFVHGGRPFMVLSSRAAGRQLRQLSGVKQTSRIDCVMSAYDP
jgi:hypothetical protein